MSSIDHDVRIAFVGITICDGPGLEPNDGIAAQNASSADRRLPAKAKASGGGNADRITRFLADHRPALFCDYCIADKLALNNRREANRVTSALEKSSLFWRDVGACSVCAQHKQVIRHV